ncbi:MAG TPA: 2-amino-4-hydroxy-6-hydroxymethyldihydropteridine diphosphokinase [Candidatus Thioglobus sp.]|jgi:2-amino-4-hydroxy-6-hydroxymethyldihydropteridine diphosphokinase|nr:2-amino-4-hydroxy-6-hydroxymethyldihydropteridine diphosphokinase [Candidatus Thioglobus sp.]HIL20823.1 2-amino-4-hydroxy-6-hydroxymethyldihydropteridine diphosphokinase [Candidatus Thioglobus sp.]
MSDVHINIGSNEDRALKLTLALKALEQEFSNIVISSLYESPAEGFEGNDFYNIGINASTDKSTHETRAALKKIEDDLGRDRNLTKFSARMIDLDLVLYDDVIETSLNLPRADILKYGYVLAPLAELNASKRHPIEGQTYQELWREFQSSRDFVLSQYNIDKLFK